MKLVVISPEDSDPREIAVLGQMLDQGLERFHVRKPAWSDARISEWLRSLPKEWLPRLTLHSHPQLAADEGLGGIHGCNGCGDRMLQGKGRTSLLSSRSCHTLGEVRESIGSYDSVFFSPVFASLSKPGYGPGKSFPREALKELLTCRAQAQRRTAVIALGGITAERLPQCRDLGFDGVAAMGAIWRAADPVLAFRELKAASEGEAEFAQERQRNCPLMCLTQDGIGISHIEQTRRLCAAGAKWIQLRMKNAVSSVWLSTAREAVEISCKFGTRLIVNDSVEVALAAGADGVHLGRRDCDWREARERLGPRLILGGTVNNASDAQLAVASGCLDYVGVGPLRFTSTKNDLSPVLGLEGIRELIGLLDGLPSWAIGGVEASDLASLRAAGAAGAALSSALFRAGRIEENLTLLSQIQAEPVLVPSVLS